MVLAVIALLGAMTRCVPHPVGTTRTYASYKGKATTTAEGAVSAARTVLLMTHTAAKRNAFSSYTAMVIADAEDGISGLIGTFDSVQPPNAEADRLHERLDTLLSSALTNVQALRVAARRGVVAELAGRAGPLRSDVHKLQAFVDAHQ
ncbi:MAG: hypothetical protein QOJ00_1184 [Actinomycetota bacterium]